MSKKCLVCNYIDENNEITTDFSDYILCNCPICGKYKMSKTAQSKIEFQEPNPKLSSWISERHKVYKDELPYIDSVKLHTILNQREKTIREKFDCFMHNIYFNELEILDLKDFKHCFIKNENEFKKLIAKAYQDGYFKDIPKLPQRFENRISDIREQVFYGLTFEGVEYIESLNEPNKDSNKIFMAFWFDPQIQKIFDDMIKPKIDSEGFLAERVSSSTTALENKISDEIIGMIKSSRAVIADCTGNRTAVYYEAGYAMGMKIPVIWTCKADQVGDICFDVSQHPFILWDSPEELADKIVKRLKAIL